MTDKEMAAVRPPLISFPLQHFSTYPLALIIPFPLQHFSTDFLFSTDFPFSTLRQAPAFAEAMADKQGLGPISSALIS
jgi:hypothetical protein